MDRLRVGQRNIFERGLVGVHPMRMRVINAEELEPPLAEFRHEARDLRACNLVVPDRISCDVPRRECLRDDAVLPRQNSAAFSMGLVAGMLQELSVDFAATLDGALHFGSIKVPWCSIKTRYPARAVTMSLLLSIAPSCLSRSSSSCLRASLSFSR